MRPAFHYSASLGAHLPRLRAGLTSFNFKNNTVPKFRLHRLAGFLRVKPAMKRAFSITFGIWKK
jgi:hypothetical protein